MDKKQNCKFPENLIIGFLSNELTPDECHELEKWLTLDESHKKFLYEMTELWLSTENAFTLNKSKERVYARFRQRIINKKNYYRRLLRYSQFAAAIIIGILILRFSIYMERTNVENHYMVQAIEVPLGSRSRIILQDGTIAWLNAGSRLISSLSLSAPNRTVYLEGEAYFEVVTNKKKPFVVETHSGKVEVLGTKFNIKDYIEDENIEIILDEGSVRFINTIDSLEMKPNQQLIFNKENGIVLMKNVPKNIANQWTTGALFFNEITLNEITKILGKSFDVTFSFRDDTKKDLIFYSDFKKDNSLEEILDILSDGDKFSYIRVDDKIEIF